MKVTVIGGGVAGLQTAIALKELGVTPIIIEKENHLGGKLCGWHKLFPTMTPAKQVLTPLLERVKALNIEVKLSTEVIGINSDGIQTSQGHIASAATVICSGFNLFDTQRGVWLWHI